MTSTRLGRLPASLLIIAAGAVALAGCTGTTPAPSLSPSPTVVVSDTPSATPTPTGPALVPEGSADDNLPYFAELVAQVWNGGDRVSGRAYVDALVAAGFDKSAMQVTADQSTVGNPAESIQFSVRWGQECLIGQVGPATGNPVSIVAEGLPDGGCLLGRTRTIDW
ncbi:hypothetical protein LQ938_08615 [Microbacterium sp. cx-55]|uniref:DUF6993 domain-containing protein n=1 Tax=Microbacterium sp. cx-55 TaxID=2875948 RepID=UPI001CBB50C4|nr:hypothetical protein [Microbacterium sp. cx-55]UGB33958.1 hypothetical protein LQ938_08615 [Microbacterium sp. cx-55]